MGATGGGRRWQVRLGLALAAAWVAVPATAAPVAAGVYTEISDSALAAPPGYRIERTAPVSKEELARRGVTFEADDDGKVLAFERLMVRDDPPMVVVILVAQTNDDSSAKESVARASEGAPNAQAFVAPYPEGAAGWTVEFDGVRAETVTFAKGPVFATVAAVGEDQVVARQAALDVSRLQFEAMPTITLATWVRVAGGAGLAVVIGGVIIAVVVVVRGRRSPPVAAAVGVFGTGVETPARPAGVPRPAPAPSAPRDGPAPAGDRRRAWFDTPLPPVTAVASEPPPPPPLPPSRSEPVTLPADPDWWRKRRFEPHFDGVHRLNEDGDLVESASAAPARPEPVRGSPPVSGTPASAAQSSPPPPPPVPADDRTDKLADMFDRLLGDDRGDDE